MAPLPEDGDPISLGVGALLAAIAFALKEWASWYFRRKRGAKEPQQLPTPVEDAAEPETWTSAYTLHVNEMLRDLARDLGACSAVIVVWQPTDVGGRSSVIAEWFSKYAPSASQFRSTEMRKAYKDEIITPLVNGDGWLCLRPADMEPGTILADHYDARNIVVVWISLISHREGKGTLFVSVRFDREPELRDAQIRDRISQFISQT